MELDLESNEKGGLCILDSATDEGFQNVIEFFSLLLKINQIKKDVVGDSNLKKVSCDDEVK